MVAHPQVPHPVPARSSLRLAYAFSLGIAVLTAVASAAGLIFPTAVYPTDELRRAFVPNDVVNLLIGLPILIGSMMLAARGKLVGWLFWPGALMFFLYNYLIYLFCMPPQWEYLLYPALVAASAYTLIGLVAALDADAIQARLSGAVPARLCGGVLAGLGALFLLRVIGIMAGSPDGLAKTEFAVNIADVLISPAWIVGGVLLWRRKALGYAGGLGLLFSLSMLFIGLIFIFLLEPFRTGSSFRWPDMLVILVMGMIAFVPFFLFLRGVAGGHRTRSA
ncbi:MAG: hypothetical protein WBM17_14465 [Anaerolineales bacterium]